MGRVELERLSKEELIELVLRLQRPEKTSRTSSKPPSTDRKEQRERSKPGGAKPGHEGHSRVMGLPTADQALMFGEVPCVSGWSITPGSSLSREEGISGPVEFRDGS
jgi:transposase